MRNHPTHRCLVHGDERCFAGSSGIRGKEWHWCSRGSGATWVEERPAKDLAELKLTGNCHKPLIHSHELLERVLEAPADLGRSHRKEGSSSQQSLCPQSRNSKMGRD